MPIAVFGRKAFEVSSKKTYTFDGLQYGSSLSTESQDAAGKKPSTYTKGPELNTLSFKVMLDVMQGVNPRQELDDWEKIKDAAVAYPFILKNKPLGSSKWLLESVQLSNTIIDNLGNILAGEINLQFKEYVRAGKAKVTSTTGGGVNVQHQLLNNQDKEGAKRDNPNMKVAFQEKRWMYWNT